MEEHGSIFPTWTSRRATGAGIIGLVLLLLFLLAYFSYRGSQAEAIFQQGVRRHQRVAEVLTRTGEALNDSRSLEGPSSRLRKRLGAIRSTIPLAKKQAELAARDFRQLETLAPGADQRKAAMEARHASEAAFSGLKTSDQLLARLPKVLLALDAARQSVSEFDRAFEMSNAAVIKANNDQFVEAKKVAVAAFNLFQAARSRLERLRPKDIAAELRPFRENIKAAERWTASIGRQADAGRTSNIDQYNKLVQETNALSKSVSTREGGLERRSSMEWVDRFVGSLSRSLREKTKTADKQWRRTIDLWSGKT